MPEIIARQATVGDDERLRLASLCRQRNFHVSAAQLYQQTPMSRLERDELLFTAGLAAARAGIGQSLDALPARPREREAWRRQAVEWFRSELERVSARASVHRSTGPTNDPAKSAAAVGD